MSYWHKLFSTIKLRLNLTPDFSKLNPILLKNDINFILLNRVFLIIH